MLCGAADTVRLLQTVSGAFPAYRSGEIAEPLLAHDADALADVVAGLDLVHHCYGVIGIRDGGLAGCVEDELLAARVGHDGDAIVAAERAICLEFTGVTTLHYRGIPRMQSF